MNNQNGYMDAQLPPIIIGAILFVGLVHVINTPEDSSKYSPVLIYLGFLVPAALFVLGCYMNKESLECPESPFNKHVSPILIATIIIGSLGYGIWRIYSTPYKLLVFFFAAGIIASIVTCVLLIRSRFFGR